MGLTPHPVFRAHGANRALHPNCPVGIVSVYGISSGLWEQLFSQCSDLFQISLRRGLRRRFCLRAECAVACSPLVLSQGFKLRCFL